MPKICSFKLVNGQELIAEFVTATGTGYKIKTPLVLHVLKGQDGKEVLAFSQWSIVHKENAIIDLFDHALLSTPVDIIDEIADSYIQQTSSLILPPAANGKILHG